MTMPSEEDVRAMFPKHPDHGKTTRMIRADIAEELARALEMVRYEFTEECKRRGVEPKGPNYDMIINALSRYHEAVK